MFLNQDFRFAILAIIDYTSNRLFWSRLSHFSHPERLRRPGRGPPLALPGWQKPGSASFQAGPQTPIRPSPHSFARFASLPRPIRCASATLRSAHHAPEQPPGQVALRQHQPVVPRVLDQPAAGLHQPLLQAGQGPTFDLLRQHQPPPLNAFCGPEPWHTSGWDMGRVPIIAVKDHDDTTRTIEGTARTRYRSNLQRICAAVIHDFVLSRQQAPVSSVSRVKFHYLSSRSLAFL